MADEKTTEPAKGKDNNKRLAALEAGVSALTLALTENGVAVAEDADPIELAIARVKVAANADITINNQAETIRELEGNGNATEGEIAAIARAEAAEKRVVELEFENKELEQDVADAISEKNRLANELAGAGQSANPPAADDTAEPPVEQPVELVRPESARDVGPTYGRMSAAELTAQVQNEAAFEIAFSNGEWELTEFGPILIAPGQLVPLSSAQFAIAPAIIVKGPTSAPETLAGAGLLLDGEQVGYCAFDPPIRIEPGQERKFDRALIFG